MRMKKYLVSTMIVAVGLTASTGALAQSDKPSGSGPNPFSDCGVGAALFPETKWAAVTSNIIWDIGITAVVSATSSPQTCSGKRVVAAAFINATYEKLAEETAAGSGEHLTAVLNILECKAANRDSAALSIRTAMSAAVSAPEYVNQARVEKASAMYNIVENSVRTSCTA